MSAKVTIKLFASFREVVGEGSLDWPLPPSGSLTAGELLTALVAEYPALNGPSKAARIILNHQYASPEAILKAGDEIAFIPPVGGG